ncbi:MAG: lipid-A-disaccharide synthase [Flavobacteriales bacterium]|nr:lipid-A-disaccharide synthase [Flavobacteriales bacterium]MBK6945991.1 lipid-A-disaccharide synthase [Flavobacteriales bacterium]MBK7239071.1 lipid-A-disaccharide synthase [Flavobacteriales bacterium]MBK7296746.1 lipid-A-disaccharide synthase [Flavobacteriales bacterium]MBK9536824.1 lipid-A-disaccharide synthase [Flavobacteriales bacterium]
MSKRIYIIAGEASGDLHGGNLVKALFNEAAGSKSELKIRGWGGDRMAAAGADVVKHYSELAFMGFTQVIMNLRSILRNIDACKADIAAFTPDAIILIDYPGFNLRIAQWAHEKGIPVHYYISPQVWAWKKGRVHTIKKVVDRMYVILPFEKEWYAQYGMDVDFVGHPLLDAIEQEGSSEVLPLPGADGRPVIALLPGSRRQEIVRMLPLMINAVRHFPQFRAVVAAAPSVPDADYVDLIGDAPITLVKDRTYDILRTAHSALVTSGTATLETALFGVPEVVCYSGSAINVWLAKRLVNIEYISLVNLIMEREVVRELIQSDLNEKGLSTELERISSAGDYRNTMIEGLSALREKLGGPGASKKVAKAVWITLDPAS